MGWTSQAFDELLVGIAPDQRYIGNNIPAELVAFSPDYTWYAVDQWQFPNGDYYWQALVKNTAFGIDQQMEGICVGGAVTLLTIHEGAGSADYPAIKYGSSFYNALTLSVIYRGSAVTVDDTSSLAVAGGLTIDGHSAPRGWVAGASSTAATVASSTGAAVAVLTAPAVTYQPGRVYRIEATTLVSSAVAQTYRMYIRQDNTAGAVLGDTGDLNAPSVGTPGGAAPPLVCYVRNTGAAAVTRDTLLALIGGTAADPVAVVTRNAVPAVLDIRDVGSTQDIKYGRVVT